MHLHIAGIGGTFMAGLALLARSLGHRVTGSDRGIYPPMSTQLADQGIDCREGYDVEHLAEAPDCVVIGNALSRGNALVEAVLDRDLPYISGAQWVAENVLRGRWVLAVAGTHGKTTTASMLAWILEYAGVDPGFLIGGVPTNFGVSARLTDSRFFVIEADEYDTAFFDKRSKFIHYRPRTLVMNNLEYDHADIFPTIEAIKVQFQHLLRTVPASGRVIVNGTDANIADVVARGCWTPVERFGSGQDWHADLASVDGTRFRVFRAGRVVGEVRWALYGRHNVDNALAALVAAAHAGIPIEHGIAALASFHNTRRRLEIVGGAGGATVYDDFAHHPTAIAATIEAVRARVGKARIVAAVEPRSNTMRLGVHKAALAESVKQADRILFLGPADLGWNIADVAAQLNGRASVHATVEDLLETLVRDTRAGDHVVIMSNGSFGGLHARLLQKLSDPRT